MAPNDKLQALVADNTGPKLQDTYDFIIVGGGTTGLVTADRLSESGKHSVLVVEAGPDPHVAPMYQCPGEVGHMQATPLDWNFLTEPQPGLDGRQIPYRRGKGLGGCSNINGCFYGRGSAAVYDQWEKLGNPGWGWKDVYPEFIRTTRFNTPVKDQYNKAYQTWEPAAYGDGPLNVGYQGHVVPSNPAFIEACSSIGIPIVKDLNSGSGVGAKQGTAAVAPQYRRGSAYDFYEHARGRPNLKVMHDAPAQRLVFDSPHGKGSPRCTGVVFMDNIEGVFRTAAAKKEVILSLGAVQSPQLLMVSGIGPRETLTSAGIPPLVANENIGQHFMDHHVFSIMVKTNPEASMHRQFLMPADIQACEEEYLTKRSGVYTGIGGATNTFQQYSDERLRSIKADAVIDAGYDNRATVEFLFEAMFYPVIPTKAHTPAPDGAYFSITASSMVPLSEGSVTIRSGNMADLPIIDPNYYAHSTDRIMSINAFRDARKILASPALAPFTVGPNHGELSPGPAVASDDDDAIFEYIKSGTFSNLHASGTCAMLPKDKGGVVDPQLRVYGVDGLRVADVSILPTLPDTHLQGPAYMIGGRVASFLQEEYGV
ncbi:hypothetical protein FE257_000963 [Aspergillus nanangensis]|uniref:Glucose-methanol-choline oxidoreductase N-terminal domain-containing protein n=1 Tax=Aspergillus nanangensis TaxID=2582783 RepID=A0AAD4CEA1_ASPNN|nr:hypothetical protein FE257_000963 [Aspergillus nanangensis]